MCNGFRDPELHPKRESHNLMDHEPNPGSAKQRSRTTHAVYFLADKAFYQNRTARDAGASARSEAAADGRAHGFAHGQGAPGER